VVEYLRVFDHAGFFFFVVAKNGRRGLENGASTKLVKSRNSQICGYAEESPAWHEPGQFLLMVRSEANERR
jgi:hypothetical protein